MIFGHKILVAGGTGRWFGVRADKIRKKRVKGSGFSSLQVGYSCIGILYNISLFLGLWRHRGGLDGGGDFWDAWERDWVYIGESGQLHVNHC